MPAFTDKYIKSLKPKEKRYYVRESAGPSTAGFAIRVTPNAVKTFYYIFTLDEKKIEMALGQYPGLTLKDAREKYREARERKESGRDPRHAQAVVKVGKAKGTLGELVAAYVEWLESRGKVSAKSWRTDINNAVLSIIPPGTPANKVTADDIKRVLHAKIANGTYIYANRLRSMIHSMYKFGIQYDNDPAFLERETRFGITANPVTNIPTQSHKEKPGKRVLTPDELKFHFENFNGPYGFLHKLMIILGGQRPGDLLATKWSEIDTAKKVLDPSRRTKNEVPNVLPLSAAALNVLDALKMWSGHSPYLFPCGHGGRENKDKLPYLSLSGNSRAVLRLVRDNKLRPYDSRALRRTMKTLMGEAGISKDIRDRIQNHALTDVSSHHYDRYYYLPEKREALKTWENYLVNVVKIAL